MHTIFSLQCVVNEHVIMRLIKKKWPLIISPRRAGDMGLLNMTLPLNTCDNDLPPLPLRSRFSVGCVFGACGRLFMAMVRGLKFSYPNVDCASSIGLRELNL